MNCNFKYITFRIRNKRWFTYMALWSCWKGAVCICVQWCMYGGVWVYVCIYLNQTMGPFKSFVMSNKAFRNLFCNPQEFSHLLDSNNRGCQSFFKLNNSIYKKNLHLAVIFLVNAFVEFEEWLPASIIRVGRFRRGVKTLLWITE